MNIGAFQEKQQVGQCEQASGESDIVAEVKSYRQLQDVHAVNRDGDLYFIECPECHTTNVNALKLFGCKSCHTRFSLYGEDGFKSFRVESESGPVSAHSNRIHLLQLKTGDYFVKEHLPRNDGQLGELKKAFPEMKVIELSRDFRSDTGKDAHGHQRYKRYALIPLN